MINNAADSVLCSILIVTLISQLLVVEYDRHKLSAREFKSDALFITRLGTRPTGESIRKIIKSKLRQPGIDEKEYQSML